MNKKLNNDKQICSVINRAAVETELLSPYPPHTHTHGDPHGDTHTHGRVQGCRGNGTSIPIPIPTGFRKKISVIYLQFIVPAQIDLAHTIWQPFFFGGGTVSFFWGRVAHTRQEARSNDFLAVGPAVRILQHNVECLTAAKRSIIRDTADRHNVDVICLQETHVDADCASRWFFYQNSRNKWCQWLGYRPGCERRSERDGTLPGVHVQSGSPSSSPFVSPSPSESRPHTSDQSCHHHTHGQRRLFAINAG